MPTLHWIGKDKVINHHRDVPFHVLNQKYAFNTEGASNDANGANDGVTSSHPVINTPSSDNKIIHGDNLLALKALLPQYEGKIKCIYIDPPYNTGNEGWVYNDNVNDPKIKKWLAQTVGKEGEDLSRHDKWLCMMYPRLKLLHQLLAKDGAIFISIDDNEQANLKLIMDEIFGMNNFVTNIIWQKKYTQSNDAKYFSNTHDFLVCYARHKVNFELNSLMRTTEQNDRYLNIDNDPKGPWMTQPLHAKSGKDSNFEYEFVNGVKWSPPKGTFPRYSNATLKEAEADNKIWFGANGTAVPRLKKYLSEMKEGVIPKTIWLYNEVGSNDDARREVKNIFEDNPFATPKPSSLIERVIRLSTNPNDLILDSFAGSGTTAHAVLNLNKQDGGNRKFILIEMEDYAETITAERVKRVIKGYGTTEGVGGDFGFYDLGASLFDEDGNLNEAVGKEKIREYVYYTETEQFIGLVDRETIDGVTSSHPVNKTIDGVTSSHPVNNTIDGVTSSHPVNNTPNDNPYFMGVKDTTAYYFYYEPTALTTLDMVFLSTIRTQADMYIIYADNVLLSADFMKSRRIIFKKIPRDVRRF